MFWGEKITGSQQRKNTWFRIWTCLLFWGINQNCTLVSGTLNSFVLYQSTVKESTFRMRCYRTPWQNQAVGLQTALSDEHTNRFPCRILPLYSWTCFTFHYIPSSALVLWLLSGNTVTCKSSFAFTFDRFDPISSWGLQGHLGGQSEEVMLNIRLGYIWALKTSCLTSVYKCMTEEILKHNKKQFT